MEVQLSGPGYQDLTLIDLPGIVRLTGRGESTKIVDEIATLLQTRGFEAVWKDWDRAILAP